MINHFSANNCIGQRHLQVLIVFCGLAIAYSMRVNLSVAIVAMTAPNGTDSEVSNKIVQFYSNAYKTVSNSFWRFSIGTTPSEV